MSTVRRILFLTGTRADFGKLKPLIAAVQADDAFDYHIYATGMHLLERHGMTVNEIPAAGFDNFTAHANQMESSGSAMDLVLARTVERLGQFVREGPPDLLVVHGDRVEALAGAVTGILNDTLVAHVEGGEISGTVDELVRHAISKLSHVHLMPSARAVPGMSSTPSMRPISHACRSGRAGAKPTPQFPMTTVVTPCQHDGVRYGSQVTWPS